MLEEEKRRAAQQRKGIDPEFPSIIINEPTTIIDDELFMTRKPNFVIQDDSSFYANIY